MPWSGRYRSHGEPRLPADSPELSRILEAINDFQIKAGRRGVSVRYRRTARPVTGREVKSIMNKIARVTGVLMLVGTSWLVGVSANADDPTDATAPTTSSSAPTTSPEAPPTSSAPSTAEAPTSSEAPSSQPPATTVTPPASEPPPATETPTTTEAPPTTVAPPASTTTEAPTTAAPELTGDSMVVLVAIPESEVSVEAVTDGVEPEVRSATLACKPTEGNTHPSGSEACAEVAGVNGDFSKLTAIDAPQCADAGDQKVALLVTGTWNGADVLFEQEFPNWCSMENAAKTVYRF